MKTIQFIFIIILGCGNSPIMGQSYFEKLKALDQEVKAYFQENQQLYIRPDTSIITGGLNDAIAISFIPDARVIGVLLLVDEGYAYNIDELVKPTKSYFDHYNLPAIIVKNEKVYKGKGACLRIYIDGECFVGDVETGGLSLYELQQNHEFWFEKIKMSYRSTNLMINDSAPITNSTKSK